MGDGGGWRGGYFHRADTCSDTHTHRTHTGVSRAHKGNAAPSLSRVMFCRNTHTHMAEIHRGAKELMTPARLKDTGICRVRQHLAHPSTHFPPVANFHLDTPQLERSRSVLPKQGGKKNNQGNIFSATAPKSTSLSVCHQRKTASVFTTHY